MKHLLLPIDGSERSTRSVELVRELFTPEEVDVTLINVQEEFEEVRSLYEMDEARKELMPMLDEIAALLPDFRITKHISFGRAGQSILEYAEENNIDIIIITKATHPGLSVMIGSVAIYLVKHAKCIVMIAPDQPEHPAAEA